MKSPITGVGVALGLACSATARADAARMAPIEQYLMADRSAALARSAAPDSVPRDAEVLVLTPRGYETAAKGGNGFVCFVERSWGDGSDDPEFWSPKARAPLCLNASAVRSYLPLMRKRTELALAGRSKAQIFEALGRGQLEGAAHARARRDVLHDVEERPPERPRRPLTAAPHVLCAADRAGGVGRWASGCRSWRSRAPKAFHKIVRPA
jgi:hypothetical protein